MNRYAYANGNPVIYVDPSGHAPEGTGSTFTIQWNVGNIINNAYMKVTEFHFEQRDALNVSIPSYSEVIKKDSGWTQLPYDMSVLHQNGIGKPELKFIHSDGREAIYDGDTLELVTDPRYKGTYNYVVPVDIPENKLNVIGWGEYVGKTIIGHGITDVFPYILSGNKNERNQE